MKLSDRPEVHVRTANRMDIPAIVSISNSSVSPGEDVGFGGGSSDSPFADQRRLSAAWQELNLVRGEEVLVAEADGRVVGCVTVQDRGEALELINIDVPREWQGRGIGTAMVRFVEDRARRDGKRAVTLGTSRNAAGVAWKSLPWWLSRGYRITGEEENDWTRSIGVGVREIRMRKEVGEPPSGARDVILRKVEDADLPIFFEQQRDPTANRMAAFIGRDPSDRVAFMAHWAKIRGDGNVTIRTIMFDGRVVGSVATYVDAEFGKPEVTYWLGKEYWGKGLATSALSKLLQAITVRPIYGRAAKDNVASIRVMEKCGFKIIGYEKGFAKARGELIEEAILELPAIQS